VAYERFRGLVNESDSVTRIIAGVALLLLLVIALPSLVPSIPGLANGAACDALYSPNANGNHQSLMALNADPTSLHLELDAPALIIPSGQPLTLAVRFINESTAPITLAFVPDESVFRFTGSESGLMFSIITASGAVLGEPQTVKLPAPIRQQFPQPVLHLLSPRQHCTQSITIAPNRLAAAGMASGQFQLVAVYRNLYTGVVPAIGALTPTPIFGNQGVWVTASDGVRSNPIIISIGS